MLLIRLENSERSDEPAYPCSHGRALTANTNRILKLTSLDIYAWILKCGPHRKKIGLLHMKSAQRFSDSLSRKHNG